MPLSNRSLDGKSSKCSSFNAIVRSIPRLIILLKIKRNEWARKLSDVWINLRRRHPIALKAFCSLNERLDCLPSSKPLINGTKACDQVLQRANLPHQLNWSMSKTLTSKSGWNWKELSASTDVLLTSAPEGVVSSDVVTQLMKPNHSISPLPPPTQHHSFIPFPAPASARQEKLQWKEKTIIKMFFTTEQDSALRRANEKRPPTWWRWFETPI